MLVIPKKPAESLDERKIDYDGIAILTGGLAALLLAPDEGVALGWVSFDEQYRASAAQK